MTETSSLRLPKWVLLGLAGAAMISAALIYLLLKRSPQSPPAVIVSGCRDVAPGIHRISSQFRIQFDIPESDFTIRSGTPDMAIGTYNVIALKDGSANLEIGYGSLDFDRELNSAFPTFSARVEERNVLTPNGRVIGKDRWGYLRSGERWRDVRFLGGAEAGYRPITPKGARLFDLVISSACLLSSPKN